MRTWAPRLEQAVTIRRYVGTFADSTGKVTETYTDYAERAAVAGYDDALVNGTTVLAGDRRLLFSAARTAVVPTAATTSGTSRQRDAVLVDGEWLNVVAGTKHYKGATAVIYDVQARK